VDNPIKRFDHIDLLDELIEDWCKNLTRDEAIEQLNTFRIPCGKTLQLNEIYNHPNLKERGMFCDQFDFSKWGVKKATIPNRLINYSDTKGYVEAPGPEFAEHNEEIYCDLLGYSLDNLKLWKRKKVI